MALVADSRVTWNLELGTWNLATWSLELGTWELEPGTWNLDLEPGTWNLDLEPGSRGLETGNWSLGFRNRNLEAGSWSLESPEPFGRTKTGPRCGALVNVAQRIRCSNILRDKRAGQPADRKSALWDSSKQQINENEL